MIVYSKVRPVPADSPSCFAHVCLFYYTPGWWVAAGSTDIQCTLYVYVRVYTITVFSWFGWPYHPDHPARPPGPLTVEP